MRYNLDEDPRKMEHHVSKDVLNSRFSASALGGAGFKVVALSSGRHIFFYAVGEGTGKQVESIGAAHGSSGMSILSMQVRNAVKRIAGWGVNFLVKNLSKYISHSKRAVEV